MSSKIRVAIVGSGMIANKAHIPAYFNISDKVEIIGVSDRYESNAKETAERHNIANYYTDTEKMITDLKPDLISVCSPNVSHKPFTKIALENGCHVICEKPLALTYSDTKELFELAKSNNKHFWGWFSR